MLANHTVHKITTTSYYIGDNALEPLIKMKCSTKNPQVTVVLTFNNLRIQQTCAVLFPVYLCLCFLSPSDAFLWFLCVFKTLLLCWYR